MGFQEVQKSPIGGPGSPGTPDPTVSVTKSGTINILKAALGVVPEGTALSSCVVSVDAERKKALIQFRNGPNSYRIRKHTNGRGIAFSSKPAVAALGFSGMSVRSKFAEWDSTLNGIVAHF